jgi:CYTH domain-containing protein
MEIDRKTAASLGFLKTEYIAVERERRWLCRAVPQARIVKTEIITDIYVSGTRLRLREARPVAGGAAMLRLSRKADADASTRLITSIYLPEDEFAVLKAALKGPRIEKLRHRLAPLPGIELTIDEFRGPLDGLILAEAQFDTDDSMAAFAMPDFALREVTDDPCFTGVRLANEGLPPEPWIPG